MPSKIEVTKRLLNSLEGQTILFGTRLSILSQITPYVITNPNVNNFTHDVTYYHKKGKKYYKEHVLDFRRREITKEEYDLAKQEWKEVRYDSKYLMDEFNAGRIPVIATAKAIGRGVTPERVDNAVIISYSSTYEDSSQKWARTIRTENREKIAKLYFIVTENTYEQTRWFPELNKIYSEPGILEKEIDLNIVNTIDSWMI